MSYSVGQVLYVVLRKEASVYPMQVVEVITKRTLEGEVTTYMVKAGASSEKTLSISEIDGEVFDSSEKAKKVLIDRVTASITQRIDHAVSKAREWYPAGHEEASDDPMLLIKKATPPERPEKPQRQQKPRTHREVSELAEELRAEAEETLVELPDGTKARVKLPPSIQG